MLLLLLTKSHMYLESLCHRGCPWTPMILLSLPAEFWGDNYLPLGLNTGFDALWASTLPTQLHQYL